jgi:hypothetical protein
MNGILEEQIGWPTLWCLLGAGAGMLLHLLCHPLREETRMAWRLLRQLPWFVLGLAGLLVLADENSGRALEPPASAAWQTMVDALPVLLKSALRDVLWLFHGCLPTWPLAWLLPGFLSVALWRGRRDWKQLGFIGLGLGTCLAWGWLVLEGALIANVAALPSWSALARYGARWLAEALTMAGAQLLLMGWTLAAALGAPKKGRLMRALDALFQHGRTWLAVALLDALLLGMVRYRVDAWILLEVLALFSPVPLVAVCAPQGGWRERGAWALLLLRQAAWPLLGLGLTVVSLLFLVRYTGAVVLTLTGSEGWLGMVGRSLAALVLASVQGWVFLTIVLTLFHQGHEKALSLREVSNVAS